MHSDCLDILTQLGPQRYIIILLYYHNVLHEKILYHLLFFLQLGEHDNSRGSLLPHHVPEVAHRVHHGALGGDEHFICSVVSLNTNKYKIFTQKSNYKCRNNSNGNKCSNMNNFLEDIAWNWGTFLYAICAVMSQDQVVNCRWFVRELTVVTVLLWIICSNSLQSVD